jgi:hypothetical protein
VAPEQRVQTILLGDGAVEVHDGQQTAKRPQGRDLRRDQGWNDWRLGRGHVGIVDRRGDRLDPPAGTRPTAVTQGESGATGLAQTPRTANAGRVAPRPLS